MTFYISPLGKSMNIGWTNFFYISRNFQNLTWNNEWLRLHFNNIYIFIFVCGNNIDLSLFPIFIFSWLNYKKSLCIKLRCLHYVCTCSTPNIFIVLTSFMQTNIQCVDEVQLFCKCFRSILDILSSFIQKKKYKVGTCFIICYSHE